VEDGDWFVDVIVLFNLFTQEYNWLIFESDIAWEYMIGCPSSSSGSRKRDVVNKAGASHARVVDVIEPPLERMPPSTWCTLILRWTVEEKAWLRAVWGIVLCGGSVSVAASFAGVRERSW